MARLNDFGWNREPDRWLYEPRGPIVGAIVLLTDADWLTPLNDPAWTAALRRALAAVAPISADRWWTDRLAEGEAGPTAEAFVLDMILPWARERWGVPRGDRWCWRRRARGSANGLQEGTGPARCGGVAAGGGL